MARAGSAGWGQLAESAGVDLCRAAELLYKNGVREKRGGAIKVPDPPSAGPMVGVR